MDEARPHPGQPIDRLVAVSFNNASFAWSPPGSASLGGPGRGLTLDRWAFGRRTSASEAPGQTPLSALSCREARPGVTAPVPQPEFANGLSSVQIVVNKVSGCQGAGRTSPSPGNQ